MEMSFIKYWIYTLSAGVSLLCLAGCQDSEEAYEEKPVEVLYNDAMQRLHGGHFSKAAERFAEVERQHPYSNWAIRAQLMSGFAYYQAKKYDEAIESFSVFMGLHPMHKDVPYAQYMIGICHYEQVPISSRDQQPTQKALDAFQEVINRYPDSPYAKDAKVKLTFIHDHLAGSEMEVGRYYQKQGNHLAAVNRFKVVIEEYQTSSHITEALFRLVESYLSLGLIDQAQASAAVLGHNYPGSSWYKDAFALMQGKGTKPLKIIPQKTVTPTKNEASMDHDSAASVMTPLLKEEHELMEGGPSKDIAPGAIDISKSALLSPLSPPKP